MLVFTSTVSLYAVFCVIYKGFLWLWELEGFTVLHMKSSRCDIKEHTQIPDKMRHYNFELVSRGEIRVSMGAEFQQSITGSCLQFKIVF